MPENAPKDVRIIGDESSNETLLDLNAGVVSTQAGETILQLDTSGHGSVLSKVEQLTGSRIEDGVQLSSQHSTVTESQRGEKSFTERLRQRLPNQSRYEPRSELGRGGMGVVLRVRDGDLRREVAMKVLRPDRSDLRSSQGQRDLRRFVEEAQITGQLEHPGIVPVHELGCDAQGRVFFTMKMVRGLPLSDVLKNLKVGDAETIAAFPFERLLTTFLKICDALSFAHAHQVIHRDLKPANIMLGDFGEVLVMDWGLARVLNRPEADTEPSSIRTGIETDSSQRRAEKSSPEFTLDGTVVGTPAYMAPEQAKGLLSRIDQRSDVYALGAILYEILCLRPPHQGVDATQMIESAAQGDIVDPLVRAAKDPTIRYRLGHLPGSKIPRELAAIAMKALARDQESRYARVLDLKRDVECYLAGRPVSVHRDSLAVRVAKWVRRHPTLATSGTAAAAVLLIAASVIAAVMADASMKEAQSQESLLAAEKKARSESEKSMKAENESMEAMFKQASAEKKAMEIEARAKDEEMARQKAMMKRAEATVLYNVGRDQAARARGMIDADLRTRSVLASEQSFRDALAKDATFAEAAFELGNLYFYINDERALDEFVRADELNRKAGGKGDSRALVYAGDAARMIKGDNEQAQKFYEKASEVDRESVYALVGLGYAAFLMGKFQLALALAANAEARDPTLWEPWFLEGTVFSHKFDHTGTKLNEYYDPATAIKRLSEAQSRWRNGGEIYNERGLSFLALQKYAEAREDFERARELLPMNSAPLSNLVVVLFSQREFNEACKLASEGLKQFPNSAELWNEYGNCLLALDSEAEALLAFERSLAIMPNRVVALANASDMARRLNQLDKALEYAEKAVKLNAEYALGWHRLGLVQFARGKGDEAIAALKKATEIEPSNEGVALDYFKILGSLKRFADLKAAANAYVSAFPDLSFGYFWVGQAEKSLGNYDAALAAFRKAVALDDLREDYFYEYCNLLFNLKRYDDVKSVAKATLAGNKKSRAAWFYLGLAEKAIGKLEEALNAYLSALEQDPDYDRGLIGAAEACNDLGKFAEAKQHAERLIKLSPNHLGATYQRARAEEGLENFDDALAFYEKAEKLYGKSNAFSRECERVKRLKRVALMRKENRQPANAAQCFDLLWVEYSKGRLRHACAWARKLFEEFGKDVSDAGVIYECAAFEMDALAALKKKVVEVAPDSPKPPPLEETEQGHCNQCLKELRRALELGWKVDDLRHDRLFKPLHDSEGWKKLLADFTK